jgi:hypothetical protein
MTPSIWPATLAAGLTLLAFGLVSSIAFGAVGAVVCVWALANWIGDLRQHGH